MGGLCAKEDETNNKPAASDKQEKSEKNDDQKEVEIEKQTGDNTTYGNDGGDNNDYCGDEKKSDDYGGDEKKSDEYKSNKYGVEFEKECFTSFKSFICNNKEKCANIEHWHSMFIENVAKVEHIKNPKNEKHKSFWTKTVDLLKDVGSDIEDGFKRTEKEAISIFEGFENGVETGFESLGGELADHLEEGIDLLFARIVRAMTDAMVDIQMTQEMVDDIMSTQFYQMLRAIPIFGLLLPPKPPGWDTTLDDRKDGFHNWALNIRTNPEQVRPIKNDDDVKNLILDAQKDPSNIKKVRVSVFRHSFSPLFGDDGSFHGLLLPHDFTTVNLKIDTHPTIYNDDFSKSHLEELPHTTGVELLDDNKIRIKCGTATNDYVNIAVQRLENGLSWPSEIANTLQFFQGFCGTTAVGCHSGGIEGTTMCDYITRIKLINHKGEEQILEGDILKSTACHLGLLGIVIELDLQMSPSYISLFAPKRRKLEKYFPQTGPCEEFQNDVNECFYNEFFWFPFSETIFANVWKRTFDGLDDYKRWPPLVGSQEQVFAETAFQTFTQLIPGLQATGWRGKLFAKLVSGLGNKVLVEHKEPIRCPSFDACHFRHGLQNMRMLDMEWCFPLPELKDENGNNVLNSKGQTVPDVSLCRDLWWANIKLNRYYDKEKKEYPCLLPMEMRIIRGSNVLLSTAYGAPFVVYIEVLNINGNKQANDRYYSYCQDVIKKWREVAQKHGVADRMRPHWAKQWQNFTVDGEPMTDYLKNQYKDEIAKFNEIRKEMDPNNMFLNKELSKIFLD